MQKVLAASYDKEGADRRKSLNFKKKGMDRSREVEKEKRLNSLCADLGEAPNQHPRE